MHTRLAILLSIALTLGLAAVARTQYPEPTPPPPSTTSPSSTTPSGMRAVKAQAKTAATHAGFAAGGSTMSYAKEHIGHTIACIEGSKGKNVSPQWMNPCSGQGDGVLVDLRRIKASASLIRTAQEADATAVAAIKSSNLTKVKNGARRVAQLMSKIATAK